MIQEAQRHVAITCDSSIDMLPDTRNKHRIHVIPMTITMGGEDYLGNSELSVNDIFEYYNKKATLPEVKAPDSEEYFRFFTKLMHMGYEVVHFCSSKTMSRSYKNAEEAASAFQKIHVIDTGVFSVGSMHAITHACHMSENGCPADRIAEDCRLVADNTKLYFLTDTLDFVRNAGQMSALSAFFENLSLTKPSMYFDKGQIMMGKKYKGVRETAMNAFIDDACAQLRGSGVDYRCIYLGHTNCSEAYLNAVCKKISETAPFDEIKVVTAGLTTASYLGSNSILISWSERCAVTAK